MYRKSKRNSIVQRTPRTVPQQTSPQAGITGAGTTEGRHIDEYWRRIVDDQIDELFSGLPAISVEGPRGTGKTTTARLLEGRQADPPVARDGTLLGGLFESLVALCLRVYAQANDAAVFHLRTHRGVREIDFVVVRRDGRVVALEVKLARTVDDHDLRHLRWLQEQIGSDLLDAAAITTGPYAYRRPTDQIAVIPAALLGP